MGTVLALFKLLYLPGMPILTLVAVCKVAWSPQPLPTRLLRGVILAVVLTLAFGPVVYRRSDSGFPSAWWLVSAPEITSYVLQYGLLVFAAAAVLSLLSPDVRATREDAAQPSSGTISRSRFALEVLAVIVAIFAVPAYATLVFCHAASSRQWEVFYAGCGPASFVSYVVFWLVSLLIGIGVLLLRAEKIKGAA